MKEHESMVLSMRFNVKMVLAIYIQLTLRDRNSMLCLLSPCMRGDLRQNYVSNCVMQNLQFFLLAIKFFSNEIGAVIGIPQKKLKKQNRI